MNPRVVVRRAGPRDAAVVAALDLEGAAGLAACVAPGGQEEPGAQGAPDDRGRVHLAVAASEVVGIVALRVVEEVLPTVATVLLVEQLWVAPPWRRRGVGHQLLAAVVAAAEDAGAQEVRAVATAPERDLQRFLARLGFVRPRVQRSAPLPVLRARLAATATTGRAPARRAALEQLVARRRRQRRGGVTAAERPAAGT